MFESILFRMGIKKPISAIEKRYQKSISDFKNQKTGDLSFIKDTVNMKKISYAVNAYDKVLNGDESASRYLKKIESTKGDIANRSKNVNHVHKTLERDFKDFVKAAPELEFSYVGIYLKSLAILDSLKYKRVFEKAFKSRKGKDSYSNLICMIYTSLVVSLDLIGFYVQEIRSELTKKMLAGDKDGMISLMNNLMTHRGRFTGVIIESTVSIVAFCETRMSDPSKFMNKLKKIEKDVSISKENYDNPDFIPEAGSNQFYGPETSEESITVVIAIAAGVVIFFLSIRSILYFLTTLSVDIGEMFAEEAEMLSVNAARLEKKIEEAEDEKEKKRLEAVLEKQTKWKDRFIKWSANFLNRNEEEIRAIVDRVNEEDKIIERDDLDDDGNSYGDDTVVL